jgi:hypothetical protein
MSLALASASLGFAPMAPLASHAAARAPVVKMDVYTEAMSKVTFASFGPRAQMMVSRGSRWHA